jgi:rubrerythrin
MSTVLKGSQTEKNLLAAFAGESQARNRYTFFASMAKKEGFEQIAAIFNETAEHEKQHAKLYFSQLEGGDLGIMAAYPAGMIGKTLANLMAAAAGENLEWTSLYPGFADVADKEGLKKIAALFRNVAAVEEWHDRRYKRLVERMEKGMVFKRDQPVKWLCRECGRVMEGQEPPMICPTCNHPRAFFEVYAENY